MSRFRRLAQALGLALLAAVAAPRAPLAQSAGPPLRVAIVADIANFDPHQFSSVNAPLIKNLYDSLIEYTPDGKPVPSLATEWSIAPDSASVTLKLREGVKFHGGGLLNAEAVAANLVKAADPRRGLRQYESRSTGPAATSGRFNRTLHEHDS